MRYNAAMMAWLVPYGSGWKCELYSEGELVGSWHIDGTAAAARAEAERRAGRVFGWRHQGGGYAGYPVTTCHPSELAPGDTIRHPAAPLKRLSVRHPGVVRAGSRRMWVAVEPFVVDGRKVDWVMMFDDDRAEILSR